MADAPVVQPVTLTVTKNAAPVAGVRVYFLNADSSVVAMTETDATGKASAVMAAGGSVTAIDPFPRPVATKAVEVGDNDLRTFLGVKPGDLLVLTQRDVEPVAVRLIAPRVANATGYQVRTSCGSGGISVGSGSDVPPSGTVTLSDCHGTADILVLATVAGQPVSALYHPNADLTGGMVDLSADEFKALVDVTFSYTNVVANSIDVLHSLVTTRGPIQQPFEAGTGLEGDTVTLKLTEPVLAGATSIVDTQLFTDALHHVVEWGPVPTAYALDVGSVLLRDLVGQPSYNPTTKRVSWIEGTTGAMADFSVTALDVFRNSDERHWRWTVVAPYTPGELTYPTLPGDVADWAPSIGDSVVVTALANAKLPGGYDAARPLVLDLFDPQAQSRLDPARLASGPAGQAVIVETRLLDLTRR